MDYKDKDIKIKKQEINLEYKNENFKEKEFMKSIREDLDKDKNLRNKCQSLRDGRPVCIVDADGVATLSKCFPDYNITVDGAPTCRSS